MALQIKYTCKKSFIYIYILLIAVIAGCKKEDDYFITCSKESIEFNENGGSISFTFHTNSDSWTAKIISGAEWVTVTPDSGKIGTNTITVKSLYNKDQSKRYATIRITTNNQITKEITISQLPATYQDYNTNPLPPDNIGMTLSAEEIANKIIIGWNIGNTLEATGGETNWGNPLVTENLIQTVKLAGFNAIRIPCSWYQYSDTTTSKIYDSWLQRVKQVVQYCINQDMYVILNIHWDSGWLENNCTTDKQIAVNARQRAFWQQIATYFRDFDEHLLFASANEPNVSDISEMEVLLSYHQTFVDAVRSTGGKNAYRALIVQGPSTDIETTNNIMTTMPIDTIADRLMVEVHFYTPFNFTLMTKDENWGKQFYYWGTGYHSNTDVTHNATWGQESTVDELFNKMYTKFVSKGIPVIIGEFGAIHRTNLTGEALDLHTASRNYYLHYIASKSKEYGLKPFYWDAGGNGNNSFGLFNRQTNSIIDQQAITALMNGIQ